MPAQNWSTKSPLRLAAAAMEREGRARSFDFCRCRSATIGERLSSPGRKVGAHHSERAPGVARSSDRGGIHRDLVQVGVILILSTNDYAHDRAFVAHSE